jgi:hypothetical protein
MAKIEALSYYEGGAFFCLNIIFGIKDFLTRLQGNGAP